MLVERSWMVGQSEFTISLLMTLRVARSSPDLVLGRQLVRLEGVGLRNERLQLPVSCALRGCEDVVSHLLVR